MKYPVYYYSRSGVSEELAKELANHIGCDAIRIEDFINWKGVFGYLKAGYYSMTKKHIEIKLEKEVDLNQDIILVAPLWASGLPPACLTFFESVSPLRIHLIVTSLGSELKSHSEFKSYHAYVKKWDNRQDVISKVSSI